MTSTAPTSDATDGDATEHVLVLGAGSGGTMVANRVDRELGGLADVAVVDRDPTHRYQPAYYLDPFGYADLDEATRDVRDLLRTDVTFRESTVEAIRPGDRRVETSDGSLAYDRLVVALGHELAPERVPGMREGWERTPAEADVFPFYAPEPARALGDTVDGLEDGDRLLVSVPETPVSCGGAPLKFALLAEDYLADRGVDAEVTLVRPEEYLFGEGRKARYEEKLRGVWADRDVELVTGFAVESVDSEAGVVHARDGRREAYDLYAPVPPQRSPGPVRESALAGPDGYAAVDRHTLESRVDDRVYALGDCTDVPTSKTAAAARKQAEVVADNLVADATDTAYEAEYDGFAACPILTREGRAVLALYDYEEALAPAVESRLAWQLDVHLIPRFYWLWMRGYDPSPI